MDLPSEGIEGMQKATRRVQLTDLNDRIAWVLQRGLTSDLVTESVMKFGGMLVKDVDQSFHAYQLKKCAKA